MGVKRGTVRTTRVTGTVKNQNLGSWHPLSIRITQKVTQKVRFNRNVARQSVSIAPKSAVVTAAMESVASESAGDSIGLFLVCVSIVQNHNVNGDATIIIGQKSLEELFIPKPPFPVTAIGTAKLCKPVAVKSMLRSILALNDTFTQGSIAANIMYTMAKP